MINYTFSKSPYHGEFNYAKYFAKFSKSKFYFRKTQNVLNFFKICAKIYAKL